MSETDSDDEDFPQLGVVNSTATKKELTIGTRVTVYWQEHDQWYKGTVVDKDPEDKDRHLIEYDDGEEAWMSTEQDRWRSRVDESSNFLKKDSTKLSEQRERLERLKKGSRVSVWCPKSKQYYNGTVRKKELEEESGFTFYLIYFDDGDKEWVNMLHQKFRFVDAKVERVKVGSRISVWDEEQKSYFPATITKIKPERGGKPHRVKYDDNSRGNEWKNLYTHRFLDIREDASGSTVLTMKKRKEEFMTERQIDEAKGGRKRAKIKIKEEPKEDNSPKEDPTAICQEICNICNSVAKRPRSTSCHHIFCKRCITNNDEFMSLERCPICHYKVTAAQLDQYKPDHISFKPVEALEKTTAEVVRTFSSASAAAMQLSHDSSSTKSLPFSIITACQSKQRDGREYHGFYWRFQGSKDRILRAGEGVRNGDTVEQIDLETEEIINVFPSIRKAFEKTGVARVTIKRVLHRKGKANGGGFFWRYQGETHGPWPDPVVESKTAVEQLDYETGEVLNSYASLAEAKRAMGMKGNNSGIRGVCNGDGRATAKGFFWRWKGSDKVPNHMWGISKVIEIRKTKNGEVLKVFRTSREAQAYFGYQSSWTTICGFAREKEFARGYYWQYRMIKEKKTADEEVVGKRLRLLQPDNNNEWLDGKIVSFIPETGKHEILYDSGRVEHCKLEDIDYEWKNDQGQKPVEQLDLKTGELLATFQSASEAARLLGIGEKVVTRIISVCHGRTRSSNGFFWRFKGSSNMPKKPKGRRKIEQLCLKTGRVLATFDTIQAAARAVGITSPGISYCCNGRNNSVSAGGYGWRFAAVKEDE